MQVNETKLLNELTYQAYLLNRDQVWKHLSGLGLREYIALRRIQELGAASDIYSGRVFLKEFAENMRLTIRQTSRLAGELKGRGLIRWDGAGEVFSGGKRRKDPALFRACHSKIRAGEADRSSAPDEGAGHGDAGRI